MSAATHPNTQANTMDTPVIDQNKLEALFMRAVGDLSAGYAGVMVSLGTKLGLYKAVGVLDENDQAGIRAAHRRGREAARPACFRLQPTRGGISSLSQACRRRNMQSLSAGNRACTAFMGPLGRCPMESGAASLGVAIVTRPAVNRPRADPVAPATSCRIGNSFPDLSESSVFGPKTHPL
jgi:hypothetical protein